LNCKWLITKKFQAENPSHIWWFRLSGSEAGKGELNENVNFIVVSSHLAEFVKLCGYFSRTEVAATFLPLFGWLAVEDIWLNLWVVYPPNIIMFNGKMNEVLNPLGLGTPIQTNPLDRKWPGILWRVSSGFVIMWIQASLNCGVAG